MFTLFASSTLNTQHFTCYKALHKSVYKINLFHGEYTEAAITMCYKFQIIISSYVNFSEILGEKTEGVSNSPGKVEDI